MVEKNAPISTRSTFTRSSAACSRPTCTCIYGAAADAQAESNEEQVHASPAGSSRTSSGDVPSTPCVRICRYNANFYDGQICIGCYRDAFEISTWARMAWQEKAWALLDAADRVPEGCDVIEGDDSGDDTDGGSNCDFSAAISRDELLRQAKYWEEQS